MKKSFVSVIVPTYNRAGLISETIDSILNQTYKNFELIIVDDGSTGNTEEVIRKFEDSRIKYIKTDYSGVPARPRNIGVKKAKGEYIAFCDDDDMWLPEKLEKQIRIFQISKETAMLYTRYKTIEDGVITNKIFPENGNYKSGDIFKSLYLRSFILCSSAMVKRSVLDQVGLFNTDPNLITCEDADLWLRIALKHNIKCTDDLPLTIYRLHSQSISQGFSIKRSKRSFMLRKRYKKHAGNYLFCMAVLLRILRMIKQ